MKKNSLLIYIMSCGPLKCDINVPTKENYLTYNNGTNDIFINSNFDKIRDTIFDTTLYDDALSEIDREIDQLIPTDHTCGNNCAESFWTACPIKYSEGGGNPIERKGAVKGICTNLNKFAQLELESTAYMLRILTNSVIGSGKITFEVIEEDKITGRWDKDFEFIKIESITYENTSASKTGKLIMGIGPSGAGKTTMAKKIVEIMNAVDPNFPTFFLNIDGGGYRENSAVYQQVLKTIERITNERNHCYIGIENLKDSIDTSQVKKDVTNYLEFQKNIHGLQDLNLYVPDTLNSCIGKGKLKKWEKRTKLQFGESEKNICLDSIEQYRILTGDTEWIAVMIWQHKENCPEIVDDYKCKGTKKSGHDREKCESKKYEDIVTKTKWFITKEIDAYEISLLTGDKFLKPKTYEDRGYTPPKYSFKIHNTGYRKPNTKSKFEDLSVYENNEDEDKIKDEIKKDENLVYVRNGVVTHKKVPASMFNEMYKELEKESILDGGRKHKTKKRRRTKKNKKKTRKFKCAMRKKSIKKKYA